MKEVTIQWPHKDRNAPIEIVSVDGEDLAVSFEGDTESDGPIFTIDGTMTLAQLHRVTHALTLAMVGGDLSAQTTAGWARDEDLGEIVTGEDEADDDE